MTACRLSILFHSSYFSRSTPARWLSPCLSTHCIVKGARALSQEANNKVAEYQRELEALEKESAALTAKADEADKDSFSKSLHLGKVLLAVENMYAMCITARPNIQHGRATWERQR